MEKGGGRDIFHPLLSTSSSSSSPADRVLEETASGRVEDHLERTQQSQALVEGASGVEEKPSHDSRVVSSVRDFSRVLPAPDVRTPLQHRHPSAASSSSSAAVRRPAVKETSLPSESQRQLPGLPGSSKPVEAPEAALGGERKDPEKRKSPAEPSQDKGSRRRSGSAGRETGTERRHVLSVQSSGFLSVHEGSSAPGRACFICLEGVKRRKRDRKLVRDLLPCCSQCYAVVHQKCW